MDIKKQGIIGGRRLRPEGPPLRARSGSQRAGIRLPRAAPLRLFFRSAWIIQSAYDAL